jgi:NCAIR mutase (PurE)-related protein
MGTSEQDKEKVFNLSKEMIENNQHIDNQREKMKGIKGAIKAFQERNEAIVNEIEVRTGDQELFDLEEDD